MSWTRRARNRAGTVFLGALAPLVVAIVVTVGPAAAQGSRPQLLVVQAEADLDAELLALRGHYFRWVDGDEVVVTWPGRRFPSTTAARRTSWPGSRRSSHRAPTCWRSRAAAARSRTTPSR